MGPPWMRQRMPEKSKIMTKCCGIALADGLRCDDGDGTSCGRAEDSADDDGVMMATGTRGDAWREMGPDSLKGLGPTRPR